ncbi:MAG: GH3 auxin-responsive promoter family protein, partial [Muribaculaceae bacterium]|nr:GH3 auxin-responsive promoter family protein [Muribaculaceae bacterium]
MDFTSIARLIFASRAKRTEKWRGNVESIQTSQLLWLLKKPAGTEIGRKYGFEDILNAKDPVAAYQMTVPTVEYDDIRAY